MSSDPERPIEKLLRDCAKERREHAGDAWELHPANRRLLHQEVAKKFRPTEKAAPWWKRNWFGMPSWITATSGVAVMAVLVVVWYAALRHGEENKTTLLAKNEPPAAPALNDKVSSLKSETVSKDERIERDLETRKLTKKEETLELARKDSVDKDVTLAAAPALQKTAPQQAQQATPEASYADRGISPALAIEDANSRLPAKAEADAAFRQRYGLGKEAAAQPAQSPASAPVSTSLSAGEVPQAVPQERLAFPIAANQAVAQNGPSPAPETASAAPLASSPPANAVAQYGYFLRNQNLGRQKAGLDQAKQQGSTSLNRNADNGTGGPGSVLSYFRIEQSGPELRVIDSDGSVYSGQLQAAATSASSPLSETEQFAASSRAFREEKQQAPAGSVTAKRNQDNNATSGYAFQVTGTNRSSNQRVVFSGIITGVTNATDQLRNEVVTNLAVDAARSAGTGTRQFSNRRLNEAHISGQATIGTQPQISIDAEAVPAPPVHR